MNCALLANLGHGAKARLRLFRGRAWPAIGGQDAEQRRGIGSRLISPICPSCCGRPDSLARPSHQRRGGLRRTSPSCELFNSETNSSASRSSLQSRTEQMKLARSLLQKLSNDLIPAQPHHTSWFSGASFENKRVSLPGIWQRSCFGRSSQRLPLPARKNKTCLRTDICKPRRTTGSNTMI